MYIPTWCKTIRGRKSNAENMGRKGTLFSAIKRVFTPNSKEKNKPIDGSHSEGAKEKKNGRGILKHVETKSFIPFFKEPSSIEKILGEADQLLIRHHKPSGQQETPPILLGRPTSPECVSLQTFSPQSLSPKVTSPRVHSPRVGSPNVTPRVVIPRASSSKAAPHQITQSWQETIFLERPKPTLRTQNFLATKIQAAYRGYLARRSFRASRGLVRLQGVVRVQNMKRQTMKAMKQMQLVIKVQTRIHSRRIQMLEKQALQHQAESAVGKQRANQLSEGVHTEDWDDSILTKEEAEARLKKKVQAVEKRERAMTYAYSHQQGRTNPQSTQSTLSNGFPLWWDVAGSQLPASSFSQNRATAENCLLTPSRPISEHKPNPGLHSSIMKHRDFMSNVQETPTPRSSRSVIPTSAKQFQTTVETPPSVNSIRYSKPRTSAAYDIPLKDDGSLRSCPAFSVPNYMTSTISANAKLRVKHKPNESSVPGTPGSSSDRRFSFPFTLSASPLRWKKGSSKDATSQRAPEKKRSSHSVADDALSMDSTVSMPARVERKPFNRYV